MRRAIHPGPLRWGVCVLASIALHAAILLAMSSVESEPLPPATAAIDAVGGAGLRFARAVEARAHRSAAAAAEKRWALPQNRYHPASDGTQRSLSSVVPQRTSRAYILDLAKGKSPLECFVSNGFEVRRLDWGTPHLEELAVGFEAYAFGPMPAWIDNVVRATGGMEISIVGVCVVGALAPGYATNHHPGSLTDLVCFASPVNPSPTLTPTRTASERRGEARLAKKLGDRRRSG